MVHSNFHHRCQIIRKALHFLEIRLLIRSQLAGLVVSICAPEEWPPNFQLRPFAQVNPERKQPRDDTGFSAKIDGKGSQLRVKLRYRAFRANWRNLEGVYTWGQTKLHTMVAIARLELGLKFFVRQLLLWVVGLLWRGCTIVQCFWTRILEKSSLAELTHQDRQIVRFAWRYPNG